MSHQTIARDMLAAADERRTVLSLSQLYPQLSRVDAYAIQDWVKALRTARGESVVGAKLGLTSAAKQKAMGIDQPVVAWLTDRMQVPAQTRLTAGAFIHPRVEPEIVVVLGDALAGPGVTVDRAREAVSEVRAGLEVIDSRFEAFRFGLVDVIADNASSAVFAVSDVTFDIDDVDVIEEGCELRHDGKVIHTAHGGAALGDPLEALAFAANAFGERGIVMSAGWIVLTGGLTDAIPIVPGTTITATFATLGSISISMRE